MRLGKAAPKLRVFPELGCVPLELHYDFAAATGALVMADGNCCDMESCIAMFAAIDPRVRKIETVSGMEKGAVYMRHSDSWEALSRRKR